LAPHSPGTDQIDTLLWIGLIAAAIVVVLVNAGVLYALRRGRRNRRQQAAEETPRRARAGRRLQFRVGAVLTLFAAAVFVLSVIYTERARETPGTGAAGLAAAREKPLRIEATGQQWLWRYDYPDGTFSYYKLVIPIDTAVELRLQSTDVVHTWNIPDLTGKADAVPGKVNTLLFRADEEGEFEGDAATLSGQAYASMRAEVEVVSPQAYEEFVKRQQADIEAAQERVVGLIENGEIP
jgi:cytochrome c oxidase subunit 2